MKFNSKEEAAAAYRRGDITLDDLVGYRDDRKWGPVRWERSGKDLGIGAGEPPTPVAVKKTKPAPKKTREDAIAGIEQSIRRETIEHAAVVVQFMQRHPVVLTDDQLSQFQ